MILNFLNCLIYWVLFPLLIQGFDTPPAIRHCVSQTDVCFTFQMSESDIQFTVEGPKTSGYVAIGVGQGMADADIYITWFDSNGTARVSEHRGVGYTRPQIVKNSILKLTNSTTSIQGKTDSRSIAFSRPLSSSGLNSTAKVVEAKGSNAFIWAYSDKVPEADPRDASQIAIRKHTSFGKFEVNFHPTINSNVVAQVVPSTNISRGVTIAIYHGICMFFAWIVLPPIGIFVAKYCKKTLGVWWFRIHIGVFVMVLLLMVCGFCLILVGKQKQFLVDFGLHGWLGFTIMVGVGLQMILGVVIDRLWDPKRTRVPWYDRLHHYFGRILYVFGIFNVMLGIRLIGSTLSWWIPFFLIISTILGAFCYMRYRNYFNVKRTSKTYGFQDFHQVHPTKF